MAWRSFWFFSSGSRVWISSTFLMASGGACTVRLRSFLSSCASLEVICPASMAPDFRPAAAVAASGTTRNFTASTSGVFRPM